MMAKLYGEPVIELPSDLYIPPDALEVILEAFEGPLDQLPQVGPDVVAISLWIEKALAERLPQVDPQDLAEAWRSLLYRARLSRHHHISREELSVREHMSGILRRLRERRVLEFAELFEPARGVAVLVVTFLALLELARELLIEITQAECFAPIYVKLGHAQSG